jgi:hypothetical protein
LIVIDDWSRFFSLKALKHEGTCIILSLTAFPDAAACILKDFQTFPSSRLSFSKTNDADQIFSGSTILLSGTVGISLPASVTAHEIRTIWEI